MTDRKEMIFKFKEHLQVLNRSPKTIQSYVSHINDFLDTNPTVDLKQVDHGMVETYIANLYKRKTRFGKPYLVNTICVMVRAIKRFFEYLEQANLIFIDPTTAIKEPKSVKIIPKAVLTRTELLRLLDQPNLGTRLGIRDRAIIELLDSTGIRKQELRNLTIYDADLTARELRIKQGKGQKDRIIPVGKHAVRFIREYIDKIRPHYTKHRRSERSLFVDIHGKSIDPQALTVMIKKYVKSAKIKKPVTAHTLRHGFATALSKNGADIVAIQKMLGHAHLSTTEIYIRSLGLDIKRAHRKTHPREQVKIDINEFKRSKPNGAK